MKYGLYRDDRGGEAITMMLKILISLFILAGAFLACPGQMDLDLEDNWLRHYGIYSEDQMLFLYDRYSRDDLANFRRKLDSFKNAGTVGEWEGIFFSDIIPIGLQELRLKAGVGYAEYYIYSCHPELRYINYGKIVDTSDSITLLPEYATDSPRKSKIIQYIKVRWADRYYLVEEQSLAKFAEKAAGVYVEPAADSDMPVEWHNYYVTGDIEKPLTGLPVFPERYKKFQRFPIETRITNIGNRKIEVEKTLGRMSFGESAFYTVTVGAGWGKGVKKGMTFRIPDTEEDVFITNVYPKFSFGLVQRSIDDNNNDYCLDDEGTPVPCPKLLPGLKVTTPIGHFHL